MKCFQNRQRVDECGKFCFLLFFFVSARDTRFKWILAFVAWKCWALWQRKGRKSFSGWLIDAFFSDFDFYCYSFVVWRQEKNLNQTVLCYFACFSFFACALSELYEKKFRLYFSLFTERFNIYGVSLRRKNSLHDNVTQCDAGTRQRERKNQDIIIFCEWCRAETAAGKKI